MKRLLLMALLMLFARVTQASMYTGNITQANEIVSFNFNLNNDIDVKIWTESGLNLLGEYTDPNLVVWQWRPNYAEWLLLASNDDAYGNFGSPNNWDSGLALNLGIGNYLATVTNSTNNPFGPFLSDGFNGNGLNNINNIGEFTLHIDETAVVPIPPTFWLQGLGILVLFGFRQCKNVA